MFKNIFSQYKGLSKSAYVIFIGRMVTNMGSFIWPMLTMIMSIKLGYTETEIALIFLFISVLFMPATLLAGKIADHFNKKAIIVVFDIISVAFFFANAFLQPGNLMLVFFVLAGLFATMEGPAYDALVMEATLPAERPRVYSLTYLGHNIGFMFGAAISGFLITNLLSLAFVIDGVTTLMSTALIVLFVKSIHQEEIKTEDRNVYEDKEHHKTSGFSVLRKRKSVFIQIGLIMIASLIYDQWTFVLPLNMKTVFGEVTGPEFFGLVASANGLVVIVFTPILTYALRKYHEMPKSILGIGLYATAFLLLISATHLPIYFVFIFLFTLGEILNSIAVGPYLSRRIPSSHRGRINSLRNIAGMTGAIIGKLLIGYLVQHFSFNLGFVVLGGLGLLGVTLMSFNYLLDRKIFPKLYEKDPASIIQ